MNSNSDQPRHLKPKSNQNRKEIWFKAPINMEKNNNNIPNKKANACDLEERAVSKNGKRNSDISDEEKSSDDSDSDSNDEDFDTDTGDTDNDEEDGESKSHAENLSLSCSNEKKLSVYELNKRFMLNYLNTVGKLFTKVGMESYPDVCSRMLHEFKELLRRKPNPFGKLRLLQITIINISLIDLTYKSSTDNNLNNQSGTVRLSIY